MYGPQKYFFLLKWTPPSFLPLKTTILGHCSTLKSIWEHHRSGLASKQLFWGGLWVFLGHFGGLYSPLKIFVSQNGPHHRFQLETLLYWSNLAHSRYLGSSKCVLECPQNLGAKKDPWKNKNGFASILPHLKLIFGIKAT